LITGGGIIVVAGYIEKSIKLDQVASKGTVHLYNNLIVPNYKPIPLDPNLLPTPSLLESEIKSVKKKNSLLKNILDPVQGCILFLFYF